MKFFPLLIACVLSGYGVKAQQAIDTINKNEIDRIIQFLASDSLRGRVNGSPELTIAAHFISNEFSAYGIDTMPGNTGYFHEFSVDFDEGPRKLLNVVGMLPGKSKPGEIIIISAHYDHLDETLADVSGKDRIFNGANDNASGTTAVLMLAKYFASLQNNERTIIFCLFAGEELGMLGSKSLARQIAGDSIKAVINIEMIGRTNWSGKNAFNVVGTRFTTIDEIFKKNLASVDIKVRNDYSDNRALYERSDHYSFVVHNIPAITIMCSNDYDACYHRNCDEVERLDIANMVKVIQAIAIGSATIISGEDTPRVTRK